MNDPSQVGFDPASVTDEDLSARLKENLGDLFSEKDAMPVVAAPEQQAEAGVSPQQPATQQQQAEQPQQTKQPQEQEEPEDQQWMWEEGYDFGDSARQIAESALFLPTGAVDFATDAINLIPGVNIPKLPKFKTDALQSAREISSFVVPNLFIAGRAVQGARALQAATKWKVGQGALAKFIGETGVAAGTGAFVDGVNKINEEDDNLQGSLKKMFPETFSWISDDWATLDSDSPDVKRAKNINEGVGLGIFTDLLLGGARLLKSIQGSRKVTQVIPQDESADAYFKGQTRSLTESPEEEFVKSAASREEALDNIGDYNLSKAPNLDTPIKGVHDTFDYDEIGTRSMDEGGVHGAAVDAARIQNNIDTTYGRLGSVITEAALKYGVEADNLTKRQLVKYIAEEVKRGGKYSAELASGKTVTWDEIDVAGTNLASIMVDPRMDTNTMRGILDELKVLDQSTNLKVVNNVGYNAAMKSIRGYLDEYMNMDVVKAQAYLTTSMAGQIADLAEGARYMDGTKAVAAAQEQIRDRITYLMVEKGLAAAQYGRSLAFLRVWKQTKATDALKAAADNAKEGTDEALREVVSRAQNINRTLKSITDTNPEFLKPFIHAYEYSDGNVDTLYKLNRFFEESLPAVQKAVFDGRPEIPNQIVQGAWANIYNSVLTSISTPLKAGFGNTALMLAKPIAVMGGAALSGNVQLVKRGWYQYSAFLDTFSKGLKHMGDVYSKAARNPMEVSYIMRDDLVRKNEETMTVLHEYAKAADAQGEHGPMVLYQTAQDLHDMSNHPWFRFGANAMTAFDGFTRAVLANVEARGRVWDKYLMKGDAPTGDLLKRAETELYESMFDKSGMITDKAVDFASREIALNLDGPGVKSLSGFIDQHKYLKPFLMFPKTSANMISMMNKYSPVSVFMKDYNKLAMPGRHFSIDEVKEILESKGIAFTGNPEIDEMAFNNLRAEIRGRKAIGSLTVAAGVGLFINDSLHGNGHFDKERQKVRRQTGWKPKHYKGWDGKWYSYEWLGPLGDWLALTADMMDNFDSVTENDLATSLNKMGFILGANLTDKSMLAGLEPMNDVLRGNPAAMNRWAASFASSLAPFSGARNEFGRMISPELREVDMNFFQLLRNRNKYLDAIDPQGALPLAYDWIDGKPVGYAESIWTRGWNAVMPMKVADGISEERQFLQEIEYDTRPMFRSNGQGVEYAPEERSQLFSIMGKSGVLKGDIRKIMQSTDAKKWRKQIQEMRRTGRQVDPTLWNNLYNRLDAAMRRAKALAELQLPADTRLSLRAQQAEIGINQGRQRSGLEPLLNMQNR